VQNFGAERNALYFGLAGTLFICKSEMQYGHHY
jgi:hypothetical protein